MNCKLYKTYDFNELQRNYQGTFRQGNVIANIKEHATFKQGQMSNHCHCETEILRYVSFAEIFGHLPIYFNILGFHCHILAARR
jgi:hypothetical protein